MVMQRLDATVQGMRTTVTIDDTLLSEAKVIAARTRRTVGAVIDDALRVLLTSGSRGQTEPVTLPTDGGSGLQPGVDLGNREQIAEILGDNEPFDAAR